MTDKPVLWHNPEDIYDITTIYDPEYHQGWTPLYTNPPSIEAAIAETKEKAAKVCDIFSDKQMVADDWDSADLLVECAAAIRSMK